MNGSTWQAGFYRAVWLLGYPHLRLASRLRVLHRERARRPGGYLLAANHASPFDAPLLMAVAPRMIWWLSIVEFFRRRWSRAFLTALGAMPLDRSRPDPGTVRRVVGHLRAGHVVGIFPEGRLRPGENSVLRGGELDPGVCRLAGMAGVPIIPCVVLGGEQFRRWRAWVPGAGTRWTVAFGEPLWFPAGPGDDTRARAEAMTAKLAEQLQALAAESGEVCPGTDRR